MKVKITSKEGNSITYIEVGSNMILNKELESWVKKEYVKLGDAEITIKDGKVSFVSMDSDHPQENTQDSKKSGKWEDDMVTFEILLTKAHALKAPFSIKTKMLAVDLEKKYALFKATVEVNDFSDKTLPSQTLIFQGHGDATSTNISGEFVKPHFIRMAETRAIVRALRWYTNNGVAEEEKK